MEGYGKYFSINGDKYEREFKIAKWKDTEF